MGFIFNYCAVLIKPTPPWSWLNSGSPRTLLSCPVSATPPSVSNLSLVTCFRDDPPVVPSHSHLLHFITYSRSVNGESRNHGSVRYRVVSVMSRLFTKKSLQESFNRNRFARATRYEHAVCERNMCPLRQFPSASLPSASLPTPLLDTPVAGDQTGRGNAKVHLHMLPRRGAVKCAASSRWYHQSPALHLRLAQCRLVGWADTAAPSVGAAVAAEAEDTSTAAVSQSVNHQ